MFIQSLKNRMRLMTQSYGDLIHQSTAGIILVYLLFMVGFLVMNPSINYYSWRYFVTGWLMASFSTLFVMSLAWQSWFGLQNMIRRYFEPSYVRNVLLTFAAILALFYGAWGVAIIWDIYV